MKRRRYLRLRERYRRRGYSFVYIDESGFEQGAGRRYGYALKGVRVYGEIAGNKRPRTSLLAAHMPSGLLEATQLWEGTCDTATFNQWLEDELAPHLNENHCVIMDNATFHKSKRTREIIRRSGALLLFLPPYSPDLNPIENDFANIKTRREYHNDGTLDDIVAAYKCPPLHSGQLSK
jgi:putative transposase